MCECLSGSSWNPPLELGNSERLPVLRMNKNIVLTLEQLSVDITAPGWAWQVPSVAPSLSVFVSFALNANDGKICEFAPGKMGGCLAMESKSASSKDEDVTDSERETEMLMM